MTYQPKNLPSWANKSWSKQLVEKSRQRTERVFVREVYCSNCLTTHEEGKHRKAGENK